jgi:hypothetical protein
MAMKRLIFPLFLLTLVGVNLAAEWSCSSPQSSGVFTRATSCQLAGQSVTVGNGDSLAIVGSIGANNVVPEISGTGTHRLFKVEQGGKLTLSNLKLRNGFSYGNGGGVYVNGGELNTTNCEIFDNEAFSGGGLFADNSAEVHLKTTNISQNNAVGNKLYVNREGFLEFICYDYGGCGGKGGSNTFTPDSQSGVTITASKNTFSSNTNGYYWLETVFNGDYSTGGLNQHDAYWLIDGNEGSLTFNFPSSVYLKKISVLLNSRDDTKADYRVKTMKSNGVWVDHGRVTGTSKSAGQWSDSSLQGVTTQKIELQLYATGQYTVVDEIRIYVEEDGGLGGGLYATSSTITIEDGVIADNVATQKGGGVHLAAGGTAKLYRSTVTRNEAKGERAEHLDFTCTSTGSCGGSFAEPWCSYSGKYSSGYAAAHSTKYSLSDAKSKCNSMGVESCPAVTCASNGRCTVRASTSNHNSPSGETTYRRCNLGKTYTPSSNKLGGMVTLSGYSFPSSSPHEYLVENLFNSKAALGPRTSEVSGDYYFMVSPFKIVRMGHECNSGDAHIGDGISARTCSDRCAARASCSYFISGTSNKAGLCYHEYTSSASCSQGWEADQYDFYKLERSFTLTFTFPSRVYLNKIRIEPCPRTTNTRTNYKVKTWSGSAWIDRTGTVSTTSMLPGEWNEHNLAFDTTKIQVELIKNSGYLVLGEIQIFSDQAEGGGFYVASGGRVEIEDGYVFDNIASGRGDAINSFASGGSVQLIRSSIGENPTTKSVVTPWPVCTAGNRRVGGSDSQTSSCSPCGAGRYQADGYFTGRSCNICGSGRFSSTGSSLCTKCPSGTFLADDAADASKHDSEAKCNNCPVGKYQEREGQASCQFCAPGRINVNERQTSETVCQKCEKGAYENSLRTECISCAEGKYNEVEESASDESCKICLEGIVSDDKSQCTQCESGKYLQNFDGYCAPCRTDCGKGKYLAGCSGINQGECKTCSNGKFNERDGEYVYECKTCADGETNTPAKTSCQTCPIGRVGKGGICPLACNGPSERPSVSRTGCVKALDLSFSTHFDKFTSSGSQAFIPAETVLNTGDVLGFNVSFQHPRNCTDTTIQLSLCDRDGSDCSSVPHLHQISFPPNCNCRGPKNGKVEYGDECDYHQESDTWCYTADSIPSCGQQGTKGVWKWCNADTESKGLVFAVGSFTVPFTKSEGCYKTDTTKYIKVDISHDNKCFLEGSLSHLFTETPVRSYQNYLPSIQTPKVKPETIYPTSMFYECHLEGGIADQDGIVQHHRLEKFSLQHKLLGSVHASKNLNSVSNQSSIVGVAVQFNDVRVAESSIQCIARPTDGCSEGSEHTSAPIEVSNFQLSKSEYSVAGGGHLTIAGDAFVVGNKYTLRISLEGHHEVALGTASSRNRLNITIPRWYHNVGKNADIKLFGNFWAPLGCYIDTNSELNSHILPANDTGLYSCHKSCQSSTDTNYSIVGLKGSTCNCYPSNASFMDESSHCANFCTEAGGTSDICGSNSEAVYVYTPSFESLKLPSIDLSPSIPDPIESIVEVSKTTDSITVSWTKPIFSGGIALQYIVQIKTENIYLIVTEPNTVLSNLPADSTFEVDIAVKNSAGISGSERKNITTGTPDLPGIVEFDGGKTHFEHVIDNSEQQVDVTIYWTVPSYSGGSPIIGYEFAQKQQSSAGKCGDKTDFEFLHGGTTLQKTVRLTPETTHIFHIRASNFFHGGDTGGTISQPLIVSVPGKTNKIMVDRLLGNDQSCQACNDDGLCPENCTSIKRAFERAFVVGQFIAVAPGVYNDSRLQAKNRDFKLIADGHGVVMDCGQHPCILSNLTGTSNDPIGLFPTLIQGIHFKNGRGDKGGCLQIEHTQSLTLIQNSTFENCHASQLGGGVYASRAAEIMIKNVSFISNSAGKLGGGIAIASSVLVNLIGSSFWYNRASSGGGCAIVADSLNAADISAPSVQLLMPRVLFTGVKFIENNAIEDDPDIYKCDGGALFVDSGKVEVTRSEFKRNTAMRYGAGLFVDSSEILLVNTDLSMNKISHEGSGGGMACLSSSITIKNVNVFNNSAVNGGGGWFILCSPTIQSSSWIQNQASGVGAGVYFGTMTYPKFEFVANEPPTQITKNRAGNSAGGIACIDCAKLDMDGVIFDQNYAESGYGGCVSLIGTPMAKIARSKFYNCISSIGGAGIYMQNSRALTTEQCRFENNSVTEGGGGGILWGFDLNVMAEMTDAKVPINAIENSYINNQALYGNDVASIAHSMFMKNGPTSGSQVQLGSFGNRKSQISTASNWSPISGGEIFQSENGDMLTVVLLDWYNQAVISSKSVILLRLLSSVGSLSGTTKLPYINGEAQFNDFAVIAPPSTEIELTFESEATLLIRGFTPRFKIRNCTKGEYYDNEAVSSLCKTCPTGMYGDEIGSQQVCKSCESGEYQDALGQENCKTCAVGLFQDRTSQIICKECNKGSYSYAVGASQCTFCSQGQFGEKGKRCMPCPTGKYSEFKGASQCSLCEIGKHADVIQSKYCKICPAGLSTGMEKGQIVCNRQCPAGTSKLANQMFCTLCSAGNFSVAGASICSPCPPGRKSIRGEGIAGDGLGCTKCAVGKYSEHYGTANTCNLCNAGTYSPSKGAAKCDLCPAGRFVDTKAPTIICKECPVGKWTRDNSGYAKCIECGIGEEYDPPSRRCVPCPAGKYSFIKAEHASCVDCPIGAKCYGSTLHMKAGYWTTGETDWGQTTKCNVALTSESCSQTIQNGTASFKSGSDCKPGEFFDWCGKKRKLVSCSHNSGDPDCSYMGNTNSKACKTCKGVQCWPNNNCSSRTGCSNPQPQWDGNCCAEGYTGIMCQSCKTGYGQQFGECMPCNGPSMVANTATIVGCLVIFLALVVFFQRMVRKHRLYSSIWKEIIFVLKINIDFLQISSAMPNVLAVTFPSNFNNFNKYLQFVNADVVSMSGASCNKGSNFMTGFTVMTLMPLLACVCGLAVYIRGKLLEKVHIRRNKDKVLHEAAHEMYLMLDENHDGAVSPKEYRSLIGVGFDDQTIELPLSEKQFYSRVMKLDQHKLFKWWNSHSVVSHALNITVHLLLLLHTPVSMKVFQYFNCKHVFQNRYFMKADYSIECFTVDWNLYLIHVFLVGGLYSLGLPMLIGVFMFRNRKSLHVGEIKARVGFLYSGVRLGAEGWEVHELVRKMVLTGLIVYLQESPAIQSIVGVMVCSFSLASLNYMQPMKNRWVFWLAQLSFVLTLFKFLVAIALLGVSFSGKINAIGHVMIGMDVFFYFSSVLCVVVSCYILFQKIKIFERRNRLTKIAPSKKRKELVELAKLIRKSFGADSYEYKLTLEFFDNPVEEKRLGLLECVKNMETGQEQFRAEDILKYYNE